MKRLREYKSAPPKTGMEKKAAKMNESCEVRLCQIALKDANINSERAHRVIHKGKTIITCPKVCGL